MEFIKKNYAGVLLCLAIAIPAYFLGQRFPVIGGPVFSIFIGMIIALFKRKECFSAGITFTSKKILQYAVILLGFGMNLGVIAQVGAKSFPVIVSTIATSLIISFILCKVLKIPSKISILVGVGSSICGGSAIAATAPVIDADDDEIAQSISVIFLFNIMAALIFPTLGGLMGMSNEGFGIFAGTAINDTSSVTAATSAWDDMHEGANTLDTGTIVKLTRTLAIIPITLCLAFYRKKTASQTDGNVSMKKIFPFFILWFLLASVITTVCVSFFNVDIAVFSIFKKISKFFIIMAMGAIGLNTNIAKLVKSGGKPIFMGLCCWIGIGLVSIAMQKLTGIW